jgi:putative AdoMet-dependent methyltransferase
LEVEVDPFPASDFDGWASTYDTDVLDESRFPFIGYKKALNTVVRLANIRQAMRVLDLGTGTGNLAAFFGEMGCEVLATDYSSEMLTLARRKLPGVRFVQADLRQGWPDEIEGHFDRIVSAYTFHHFPLAQKVQIAELLAHHLAHLGKLILADIAFANQAALAKTRALSGDDWEEEYYWIADESLIAFQLAGFSTSFEAVSEVAGVFMVEPI